VISQREKNCRAMMQWRRWQADGHHDVGGLYYCNGNRTQSKNQNTYKLKPKNSIMEYSNAL